MTKNKLEIGDVAPSFTLNDYRGQKVSLNDLDNYDGVLIVFMCNHCPYVKAQVEELNKLDDEYSSIAIVGINPNCETHPGDTVDKMPEFVEENDIDFYYLADPDQKVAESYGAEITPDPFLLDMRHRLYYRGRLNDKIGPNDNVEEREMKDIIQGMLKRKEPPKEKNASQGCTIKWKPDQEEE